MLLNGSEKDKLFAKLVPVSMKDVYTNQSRTSHLFLTMEWQDASAGIYNKKVLAISLTDNNDPFFLYNLHLSEEDFQMLKTSQDLLINFASFPQHIIDYIEMALHEEKNPQPKFLLVFTLNEKLGNVGAPSQFDIVETNQFKHLTHLSLRFAAATESTVRQYLISCFRHLKEEKRQLQNSLAFVEQDLKDKLSTCQHTLNSKVQELELLRKEQNVELTMKDSKHALEMQEERDRLIRRHKEEESRLEREKKEKEHTLRKDIQQLESRVNVLDTLNKEFQDKNYKHESTIRDLRSKVLSLEDETTRLKETIQSYKQKCDTLYSEAKDRQLHMHQQDEMINKLQHKLRSKEQAITRLEGQIESEIELRKSVETDLENVKFQLDMNEKTLKVLENDKEKLNEIIVGLQEKSKEATKEDKAKSRLISKYKKISEENENALLNTKKEVAELNIYLETKDARIHSLTDSNTTLQKKLDGLKDELKQKELTNDWLRRQIADKLRNASPSDYIPSSNLMTSPSSIAQKQLAKISSSSPETSTAITAKNIAPKSVRIDASSPVCRKYSLHSPSQFHNPEATDSAYCTSPSGYTSQVTPEILHGNHNMNFNQTNFEIDPEPLDAAFGNGNVFKHSTAKKPSNLTRNKQNKSTTPKVTKKR